MSGGGFILGIEISNPSSGPRGAVRVESDDVLAGPGVALGRRGGGGGVEVLGVELLHEGSRHDDDLMPAVDRLCRSHGVRARELGTVAVSVGPGGYTSLRIGVATAKMMAEASGAETVAVPSASVAAWCISFESAPAVVCLASKGQTAHGTVLAVGGAWWESVGRAAVRRIAAADVASRVEERVGAGKSWIAASGALGLIGAEEIRELRPRAVIADRFLPEAMRAAAGEVGAAVVEPVFSAASVVQIGAGLSAVDPVALAPVYSREAEAVTQWRKRKW